MLTENIKTSFLFINKVSHASTMKPTYDVSYPYSIPCIKCHIYDKVSLAISSLTLIVTEPYDKGKTIKKRDK